MKITKARETEDRILEQELMNGEIDTKEYNKQMRELDRDERRYRCQDAGSSGFPEDYR